MGNTEKLTKYIKSITGLIFACVLVFILFALFLPVRQIAFADDGSAEFIYDGDNHTLVPDIPAPSAYSWFRDGEPFDSDFSLCVRNVSDSGVYTLVDNETQAVVYTLSVTVNPRPLTLTWKTGVSPSAPLYNGEPFTYNGFPQGIFPILNNMVSGDSVFIETSLNTATNAGVYTASVGSLYGEDAANYTLLPTNLLPTFTINKKPLTLTLPNLLFNYGYDMPELSEIEGIKYSGLVSGEDFFSVVTPICVSEYSKGRGIGVYNYTFFCDSDNYEVAANSPTITVYPVHLIIRFLPSCGEYGFSPNFSYSIENLPFGVDEPDLKPYLDDYSAGTTVQRANPTDDNFTYEIYPAEYTVLPRAIEFRVKTKEIQYGETPDYTIRLTKGLLAPGDKYESLGIVYTELAKDIGELPVKATLTSKNYTAPDYDFTVSVKPMRVYLTVSPTTAVYGDQPVTPSCSLSTVLPYGKTINDLHFVHEWRPEMQYPGAYQMGGTCDNPYFDVCVITGTYTVLPRPITVFADIPSNVISEKVLGFELHSSGFLKGEHVPIALDYTELDEKGLAVKTYPQIPVVYTQTNFMLGAHFTEKTDRYVVNFVFNNAVITVYPRTVVTSDGIKITLPEGFTPGVEIQFGSLITDNYDLKYAHATDFQKISTGFTLNVSGTTDRKVTVRVPVSDPYKHYTAAIEKSDGVLTYTSCTVEDGYAVFTTDIGNKVFLLWEDKDIEPFILVFFALLIMMIAEIAIFVRLRKRYVLRKNQAFAALPFIGIAGLDFGGIYTLFALCAVEAAVCFALLIAIVVLSGKMRRLRKKGL